MSNVVAHVAATLAVAGVALSAAGTVTLAADLYAAPPIYEQRPPQRLWPMWQGFYLGANIGYSWGKIEGGQAWDGIRPSGIVGGGHGGYNWVYKNLMLGAEGDFNFSDARGRTTINGTEFQAHFQNLGSIRARAGIALERFLLYGTIGYGWTDVRLTSNDPVTGMRQSHTDGGLVYGGGIEIKLTTGLSLRAEVLQYDTSGQYWQPDTGTRLKLDTPHTEVRGGLTWHFNTWR